MAGATAGTGAAIATYTEAQVSAERAVQKERQDAERAALLNKKLDGLEVKVERLTSDRFTSAQQADHVAQVREQLMALEARINARLDRVEKR